MMKFIRYKQWLNDNELNEIDANVSQSEMTKKEHDAWDDLVKSVTILIPGGFKPIHIGHVDLVRRYAESPFVKDVKVLVGPGIRNGIDQKLAMKISEELLSYLDNVSIEAVIYPSPILTAYKYIETAKPGVYAMGSVEKDEGPRGYQRVIDFVNGHKPGGKYYDKVPKGVSVIELPINTNPILYEGRNDEHEGQPVSASILRRDVLNDDFENFQTNYPGYDDKTVKNIWNLMKQHVTESFQIFEGGNAIKASRSVSKSELLGTWEFTKKLSIENLNLSEDDLVPAGSFGKKKEEDTYGDIDILVNINSIKTDDPLNFIADKFKELGYDVVKAPGFNQVSVGIPINGNDKEGFVQVDFMLSKNLNWSKFAYGSPDLAKGESKYKGAYANDLLMAIISESFKKTEKQDHEGKVLEYSMLSYRLNSGIFKVTKTHEGKKGYIKVAKIVSEEFVTDDPQDVLVLAFGEKNKNVNFIISFEKIWDLIHSPDFIHKNKLYKILDKFRHYTHSSNRPYPEEAIQQHPEIFKVNESLYESEDAGKKVNTHMKHIEELLFEGPENLKFIETTLQNLMNKLSGKPSEMSLSVKIDGAPTMMAWSKFPGLKDYGVGTKTTFNKEPVTCHSEEDVDKSFGDRPTLAYSLKLLLKYLRKIKIPKGEIWQGDFLFNDKTLIDEGNTLAFRPNTIKYVIDKKNSEIAEQILNTEFGIIWHTRYTGGNIKSVRANFNIDISKLTKTYGIYMSEPYIKQINSNVASNIASLQNKADKLYLKIKKLYTPEYEGLLEYKSFNVLFQKFHNQNIRSQRKLDVKTFINEFMKFVVKEKGEKVSAKIRDFIDEHKNSIMLIIDIINDLTSIKQELIVKLNKLAAYKSYVELKSGKSKSINQEGFAISSPDGNVVKLVDREEFSYMNFSPDVIKGWEK